MKYLVVTAFILGIIGLLIACKSKKVLLPIEAGNPTMTLAKSTCFGKCKVYNVKIYSDNVVTYEGLKNVDRMGLHKTSIAEEDRISLVTLFEAADFMNLDSFYLTSISDVQKITLGYKEKEVNYHNRGASPELRAITKAIDAIVQKLEWEN